MQTTQQKQTTLDAVEQSAEHTVELSKKRQRCEVWTRVMGYHRPVSQFNTGKKSEHYSRKHFQECVAANNAFVEKYATLNSQ